MNPSVSLSKIFRAVGSALLAAVIANAQTPLTTTFASNNGQAGNMFDVQCVNSAGVTIKYFDVNLDQGVWDLEIYVPAAGGSYTPVVGSPGAWNLLGSATGVVSTGPDTPIQLPICVNRFVPFTATQGFCVTVTNGQAMNYTTGSFPGSLFTQNNDLQFFEGAGVAYPFASIYSPRIWNGRIHYEVGDTSSSNCIFAKCEKFATGCGLETFASGYEQLPPSSMDLGGSMISGTNSGGSYSIQVSAGAGSIAPGVGAVAIPLADDDAQSVGTLGIVVGSNCWIALGPGNSLAFSPTATAMLANPSEGIYAWTDLDSSATGGGQVFYEESTATGDVTVTYDGVFGWGTTSPNTVQFKYNVITRNFSIEFGVLSSANPEDWLVGYSPAGANADPGPTDLSGLSVTPLVTSATDFLALSLSGTPPQLGSSWDLTTEFIDPVSPVAITFFGDRGPSVPLTLLGVNAPGCDICLMTLISSFAAPAVAGQATLSVPIPVNPALFGVMLSAQSMCLTTQNPANLLTSNGAEGTIG